LKPIETVQPVDRVWDGIEWVKHDGVVYKGYKEVIEYEGLTATPEHKVYLENGLTVEFQSARDHKSRLSKPASYKKEPGKTTTVGGIRYAHVYDIVNAGPRHRFTVNTILVANCNFGFLYSLGADKLILYALMQYGTSLTRKEAVSFRKKWFDKYDGIRRWHERALRDGGNTHICKSILGRRRFMTDQAHGELLNTPIQSSGADALKISLYNVYHKLKKYGDDAKLVHCVHDEIIADVKQDPDIIAAVKRDIHDGMMDGINTMLTKVKCKADVSSGKSWASAKG
jgi:hypothetical protein